PSNESVQNYFKYLNEKTILTKKFVKDNWYKIVLIDTSSGPAIHGTSIFLNRYISNIKKNQKCTNIEGALPLRFIAITGSLEVHRINTLPSYSKILSMESNFHNINYIPSLIILIGKTIFRSITKFTITEEYPRYVPWHSIMEWDRPPYGKDYKEKFKEGLKLLKTLTKMLKKYINHSKQ
ncbi:unnamed protein product, partial [marine sediment metagenome]